MARFREAHPGVEVVVHPGRAGSGSGASARPGRVELHLEDLRDDLAGFAPQDRAARMDGHFREERTHLLQFEAARRTLPPGKDYETHFRDTYDALHDELTAEQVAAARTAYGASRSKRKGGLSHEAWDRLEKHQQAAETVRMFLEQRLAGTQNEFTRAMSKSLPERLKVMIRAAVDYLREQLRGGKVSKAVQKELDVLEGILREQGEDGAGRGEIRPALAEPGPVLHAAESSSEPAPRYDEPAVEQAYHQAVKAVATAGDDTLRRIGSLWEDIASKRKDTHQLGRNLSGQSIGELTGQLAEGMTISQPRRERVMEQDGEIADAWNLDVPPGRSSILERDGKVWVDSSMTGGPGTRRDPVQRPAAGAGPAAYQIAQAYAHNTGKQFIRDPQGVAPLARPRRWAHMLSAALRFGETGFLREAGKEFELPGWSHGRDRVRDTGMLALAELEYVRAWFPEIDSLRISADGNTIIGGDGRPLGNNPGSTLEGYLGGRRDPRVTGIGQTTLRRAIVTHMAEIGAPFAIGRGSPELLPGHRGAVPGEDSGRASDADPLHRGGTAGNEGGVLTDILHSAPAGEAGGAAGSPLDRLPPIYRRVHGAAVGGADDDEIARREGISLKAVGNILRDTKRWLEKNSQAPGEGKAGDPTRAALDRLPPIYQRVHLAAQEGEDEEEIARREKISLKAVENILRDAGRYLQKAGGRKTP